jgi:hypothetical protein
MKATYTYSTFTVVMMVAVAVVVVMFVGVIVKRVIMCERMCVCVITGSG